MITRGTLTIPETTTERRPDSTAAEIDSALTRLSATSADWVHTPIEDRIALIQRLRVTVADIAEEWVAAACAAKGLDPETPAAGEEWQAGPWLILRNLRLLERSLRDLAAGTSPRLPKKVRTTSRRGPGVTVVPTFPTDGWDRVLLAGISAETWLDPSVEPDAVAGTQAAAYRHPPEPSVCVVLGAGNVSSIAPTDTLYKLFVELRTVLLKVNPVNEYVGPLLERAFAPLVEAGVLEFAYGGVAVGQALTTHALVDAIHMTGSDKTHDAIVFGSGAEGAARKADNQVINDRHITSELGNVTPVIVVPGPWTDSDFSYQRDHLAVMLANNAGFNCIATRVLVQHRQWEHRDRLLDELTSAFSGIITRDAYYPGAEQRYERFVDEHPDAARVGVRTDARLPWTIIRDVDPAVSDDVCFTTEAFTSVLAEVGLDAADPVEFLDAAVDFCNDRLWGTLGASILVHPGSPRRVRKRVEKAIGQLRYGTVAVNQWSALGFALMSTPWGGAPGATPTDIQSGVGFVHNTYMLDHVQKTVVRGPWRVRPRPAYLPGHRRAHRAMRALTRFEAAPSARRLAPLLSHSLRG